MSYIALTYHLIFSTYRREMVINIDHERELYKFVFDFIGKQGGRVHRIGGMPDHVHILCDIPPTISVADFVRRIKSESSKFLKVNTNFPYWKSWSEGYGCLTVDSGQCAALVKYIMGQKEHHKQHDFRDEYLRILNHAGIKADND